MQGVAQASSNGCTSAQRPTSTNPFDSAATLPTAKLQLHKGSSARPSSVRQQQRPTSAAYSPQASVQTVEPRRRVWFTNLREESSQASAPVSPPVLVEYALVSEDTESSQPTVVVLQLTNVVEFQGTTTTTVRRPPLWSCPLAKIQTIPTDQLSVLLLVMEDGTTGVVSSSSHGRSLPSLRSSEPKKSAPEADTTSPPPTVLPPALLRFMEHADRAAFLEALRRTTPPPNDSHLDITDASALQAYFQYYGKMSNQMNMLQDSVRTKVYRDAILSNPSDFCGTRVMDVGAGSGILSFFAAQCGAETVFVVEASSMATAVVTLAAANPQLGSRLEVLISTVEDVDLEADLQGQKVDVIVSEPIGTFLFNERMLESFLYARDKFLRPGGQQERWRTPNASGGGFQGLYFDMTARCNFWTNQNFYGVVASHASCVDDRVDAGVNLSSVVPRAIEEQFRQPIVDYVDPASIVCQSWHEEEFDLDTISRERLAEMTFHFKFPISAPCLIHGIAGWFDVMFDGSDRQLGFSTAPWCPPTHWYQIRFVFQHPLAVNAGQVVVGSLNMTANTQQSYYITATALIEGTAISTSTTTIDLKDPDYRYYSNPQASYIPPAQPSTSVVDPSSFVRSP